MSANLTLLSPPVGAKQQKDGVDDMGDGGELKVADEQDRADEVENTRARLGCRCRRRRRMSGMSTVERMSRKNLRVQKMKRVNIKPSQRPKTDGRTG